MKHLDLNTGEIIDTFGSRDYLLRKDEVNCYPTSTRLKRKWRARLFAESKQSPYLFITLTYETAPEKPSKDDVQKFFKRLRRYCHYHNIGCPERYFLVAELGDIHDRLHYHALLFGEHFNWKLVHAIDKAWHLGRTQVREGASRYINYVLKYLEKQDEVRDWKSLKSRGLGENWLSTQIESIIERGNRTMIVHGLPFTADNYQFKKLTKFRLNDEERRNITINTLGRFHDRMVTNMERYKRNNLFVLSDTKVDGYISVESTESLKKESLYKYINHK